MTYVGSGDIIDVHRFPAREPNKRIFHKPQKMEEKTIYLPYQQQLALKTGCETLRK